MVQATAQEVVQNVAQSGQKFDVIYCHSDEMALGALLGYVIHFDTKGIEFIMTALFWVMFLNQWEDKKGHLPALVGLGGSFLCLFIFGSQNFMLPAMVLIVLCFTALRGSMIPEVEQ